MEEEFQIHEGNIVIAGKHFSMDPARTAPSIIISHEFGLSMHSTARYAKKLYPSGYHVFIYDFPGSGAGRSKGRDSTEMSVLSEVDDLDMVFQYVKSRPYTDPQHIILIGASQGGLVSALYAAEHPDEVEKLVMYYPALNIPDDARHGNMLGKKIDPLHVPSTFRTMGVRLGRKYVMDASKLDPWKEICTYAGPVLICQGEKDRIVNPEYARRAQSEYPHALLRDFQGAHHLFLLPSSVKRAVNETLHFLKESME